MAKKHYDYFVIGAGSGGTRSARIAGAHGAKVGVAERSHLGGTCVNLGCVPKKIMANAAAYARHFKDAKGFGWSAGQASFDWQTLIRRKNERITAINHGFQEMFDDAKVDVLRAGASFVDTHTLQVGDDQVTAERILIATGGRPIKPDVPGAEHIITSDDFFHLAEQPKKAVIIGGGYVAVEFASILCALGTDVTLLYYKDLFLSSFDRDLSQMLAEQMTKKGIKLCFNCTIGSVEIKDGIKTVITKDGTRHDCDTVIGAIGRIANAEDLNLGAAGVELDDKGYIKIDDQYRTSVSHVYAIGDITDTYHLTPVAIAEGHVLADRLFNKQPDRRVNYENVATVIFSDPPIGTIGLSEQKAREKGITVKIFKTVFTPPAFKMAERDEQMLMKLVVDAMTDRVIGCHVIGVNADEIMQGFAVAMNAGATKADFDRTIAIHPTVSEELVLMKKPVESNSK